MVNKDRQRYPHFWFLHAAELWNMNRHKAQK